MQPAWCLTALLLALFYLLPGSVAPLQYTPESSAAGQWWRLLSAQFVHYDNAHLWLNIAGLWLWWLLFAQYLPRWRDWLLLLPLMVAATSAHMLSPQGVMNYAGFSGCLYGLFGYAALLDIRRGRRSSWLILLVLVGKNGYDLWALPVINDIASYAHLGAIAMALLLVALQPLTSMLRRLTQRPN